jgi:hypothetical protein
MKTAKKIFYILVQSFVWNLNVARAGVNCEFCIATPNVKPNRPYVHKSASLKNLFISFRCAIFVSKYRNLQERIKQTPSETQLLTTYHK